MFSILILCHSQGYASCACLCWMVSWVLTHLLLSHSCRRGPPPALRHGPAAREEPALDLMHGEVMDYEDEEHYEDTDNSDDDQVGA